MNNLITAIQTTQTPGSVTFENFDSIRANLSRYISETFDGMDYDRDGLDVAAADLKELDGIRKEINSIKKKFRRYIQHRTLKLRIN